MTSLKGKTLFVSGGSRGIGLAIALRAARDGANVAIAAKTAEPHPKLKGTIYTAADEVRAAGGKALPVLCDIRDEAQVIAAIDQTVAEFGGIDICVNNASAISLTNSQMTDMKRFDLMMGINTRGTFMVSKYCIPHLKKADNPHILMLSPPLDMKAKWFEHSTAYTMAKFGMSMCVLGLSGELKAAGIAVNALWPRTTIATAAVGNLLGGDAMMRASRTPEIMGDAAYVDLHQAVARIHRAVLHRRQGALCQRRARLRALSRRSLRAPDVGLLRARRRRAAAGRHRDRRCRRLAGCRSRAKRHASSGRGEIRVISRKLIAGVLGPDRIGRRPASSSAPIAPFASRPAWSPTMSARRPSSPGSIRKRCLRKPSDRDGIAPAALGSAISASIAPARPSMPRWLGCSAATRRFMKGSAACCCTDPSEPYLLKSDIDALKTPKAPPLLPEIAGADRGRAVRSRD